MHLFLFLLVIHAGNYVIRGQSSSPNNAYVETVVVGNANASGTISVGYLMDQLSAPYRIGAIQMAIEDGQANGFLTGFNFR
jgi:hypothetical protein